jgi:hypothetical protein
MYSVAGKERYEKADQMIRAVGRNGSAGGTKVFLTETSARQIVAVMDVPWRNTLRARYRATKSWPIIPEDLNVLRKKGALRKFLLDNPRADKVFFGTIREVFNDGRAGNQRCKDHPNLTVKACFDLLDAMDYGVHDVVPAVLLANKIMRERNNTSDTLLSNEQAARAVLTKEREILARVVTAAYLAFGEGAFEVVDEKSEPADRKDRFYDYGVFASHHREGPDLTSRYLHYPAELSVRAFPDEQSKLNKSKESIVTINEKYPCVTRAVTLEYRPVRALLARRELEDAVAGLPCDVLGVVSDYM